MSWQKASSSPNVLARWTLNKRIKSSMKRRSRRVSKQFCEEVLYRPMLQNANMLNAKARRQWNIPKEGSPSWQAIQTNYIELWRFEGFNLYEIGTMSWRMFIVDMYKDIFYHTQLMKTLSGIDFYLFTMPR